LESGVGVTPKIKKKNKKLVETIADKRVYLVVNTINFAFNTNDVRIFAQKTRYLQPNTEK